MMNKKGKELASKILVYDNQQAYFKLLKHNFSKTYQFILWNPLQYERPESEFGMLMFFVYDDLELLDFVKLYRKGIPAVIGFSASNKAVDYYDDGNIHYLHLNRLKNEIIADMENLLKTYTH